MIRKWPYYIAGVILLALSCSSIVGASPKHHQDMRTITTSGPSDDYLCDCNTTVPCDCPIASHTTTVTLSAPWQIDGQDGNVILEGGTMSFDGKQWTYKGDFHGSGTIVFRAPISHRE